MGRTQTAATVLLSVLAASGCGSTGPSPTALRVMGLTPASGTTLGGTSVVVTGANFASGAILTFGGVAATDVIVVDSSTITGKTPQHAAGPADVIVSVGGQRAVLTGAFMFVAPEMVVNTPPVIVSLTARGLGAKEPAQFASLGEPLTVTAEVVDAETPTSQLVLAWSSDAGSFDGSGARVTWTAPRSMAMATATLTLTVTERYTTTDASGLSVTRENQVSRTSVVRVHDSIREINDLALDFLTSFSKQLPVDVVMRNFTPNCRGASEERGQVISNQQTRVINSYKIGSPTTTVPFTGVCPFRAPEPEGNGCAYIPVKWTSTVKSTGAVEIADGIDLVGAILENDQWRLCGSDFDGSRPSGLGYRR